MAKDKDGLTPKQKKFCEYYMRHGNAAKAARDAGYSASSCYSIGPENLGKPEIAAYLAKRMDNFDRKMIADTNEVLEFYTAAMRGNVDDGDSPAGLTDRIRAADALMRRLQAVEDKLRAAEEDAAGGVVILPPAEEPEDA